MRRSFILLFPIFIFCIGCTAQDNPQTSSKSSIKGATSVSLDSSNLESPDLTDPNALKIPRIELLDFDKNPYVSFPVVGVKLIRPNSYTKSNEFYGFVNSSENSTVMISELPGSAAETNANFTKEKLLERGMKLLDKEEVNFAGEKAFLYHFSQQTISGRQEKWALVFGDETKTTIVGANYPEIKKELLSQLLKKTVLSTKIIESSPAPGLSKMNFIITDSEKLKLSPTEIKMHLGAMLTYTEDGESPIKKKTDPLFLVVQTNSESNITDQKIFAKYRLEQTPHLINPSIISMKEIQVNDMKGLELLASALDEDTRDPLMIYQANLFDSDSTFLIHGTIGRVHSDKFLPEFKRMTYSIKRKK